MLIGLLLQSFMATMKGTVPPQDIIRRVANQQGSASSGVNRMAEFRDVLISMVSELFSVATDLKRLILLFETLSSNLLFEILQFLLLYRV